MFDEKLLIIEKDSSLLIKLRQAFKRQYHVLEAQGEPEAIEIVKCEKPDVVILDPDLPQGHGHICESFRILKEIIDVSPFINILIVTDRMKSHNALRAIKSGAFDVLSKPVPMDELKITVKRAFYLARLEKENMPSFSKTEVYEAGQILGKSPAMKRVDSAIQKVASIDMPVLILGESGTGKNLVAKKIHYSSFRGKAPFVAINCTAIPELLLESELFGYEKGAFTGASTAKKGRIEYAKGGTLFLDEVGELSLSLQVKLLRFLQDHMIEHVGGHKQFYIDARVVAATNRNVEQMRKSGAFREDLYFRLAAVTLTIPPLRERGDDILAIAQSFLERYSKQFNKRGLYFTDEALEALMEYDWPGNVREVENKVKRAIVMAEKNKISPKDLDLGNIEFRKQDFGLIDARDAYEKELILKTLERKNGMICRTAEELKISRQYLTRLIAKYGIDYKDF